MLAIFYIFFLTIKMPALFDKDKGGQN